MFLHLGAFLKIFMRETILILTGKVLVGYDRNCQPIFVDAETLPMEKRIIKFTY